MKQDKKEKEPPRKVGKSKGIGASANALNGILGKIGNARAKPPMFAPPKPPMFG